MKLMICLLAGIVFGAAPLLAQTPQDLNTLPIAKDPLPPAPLLTPAPDSSQWTITSLMVTVPPGQTPPAPVTYTVSKSNKIYEVEQPIPTGLKMVRWNDKQFQANYLPGSTQPLFYSDPSATFFINFSKTDYPDFFWISPRNYQGTAQVAGAKALVFKTKMRMPVGAAASPIPFLAQHHERQVEVIALVDVATRRPMMVQADGELLTYQFTNATPKLAIPKEVQDTFAIMRKRMQNAFGLPSG